MFEIKEATGNLTKLTITQDRISLKLSKRYTNEEQNKQIALAFRAQDELQKADMLTLRGVFQCDKGFLFHPRNKKKFHIWILI